MPGHYDAFISYSHSADGLLAPRLQDSIQSFAKPWYRLRALDVFRDETGLSVNPGLWSSISEALDSSDWFVLLASPESAASPWVAREIEHWCQTGGADRILPVVTAGSWVWDEAAGDFDLAASTAVPAALLGKFAEEPRHINMAWAHEETQLDLRNGRFRDQVAELVAPVRGVPKDVLTGADVVLHRRAKRLAWGAIAALIVLLLSALAGAFFAVGQANSARHSEELALVAKDRALASEAEATRARASADSAADLATRRKAEADAAATLAIKRKAEADAAARLANKRKGEAEASSKEALQQRSLAERNADQATTSAAAAAKAEQAARVQEAQARSLANSLAVKSGLLAAQNQKLEESAAALLREKAALSTSNARLTASSAELDGRGLVAAARTAAASGEHDLALLLLDEAANTGGADAQTIAELRKEAAATSSLRYLPGSGAGGQIIAGPGHLAVSGAASTTQPAYVWNVSSGKRVQLEGTGGDVFLPPGSFRTTVSAVALGGPPPPDGDPDLPPPPDFPPLITPQVELIGFNPTGSLIVGIPAASTEVTLWDTSTGYILRTIPARTTTGEPPSVELARSGRTLLIQSEESGFGAPIQPLIRSYDLAAAVAPPRVSVTGLLRSSLGWKPGFTGAPDGGDVSPDQEHFLYFDTTAGWWAIGDVAGGPAIPLPLADDAHVFPRFSPDGATVTAIVGGTSYLVVNARTGDFVDGGNFLVGGQVRSMVALGVGRLGVIAVDVNGAPHLFGQAGYQWSVDTRCLPGNSQTSPDMAADGITIIVNCGNRKTVINYFRPSGARQLQGIDEPVVDVITTEGSPDDLLIFESGRIFRASQGLAFTENVEVQRLGLKGPCVVQPDRLSMVCGGQRLVFADVKKAEPVESFAGLEPQGVVGAPNGTHWYVLTTSGRVAVVDPDPPSGWAASVLLFDLEAPTLTSDGRWLFADGGFHSLSGVKQPDQPDVNPFAVVGTVAASTGHGGQLVMTGSVFESAARIIDPATGKADGIGLGTGAVTSSGGRSVATWQDGETRVLTGSRLGDLSTVTTPGVGALASDIGAPTSAVNFASVTDDGSLFAYIARREGNPQVIDLRIIDVKTDELVFRTRLDVGGNVGGVTGPFVAFTPDGTGLIADAGDSVIRFQTTSWARTVVRKQPTCSTPTWPVFDSRGVAVYVDGRVLDSTTLAEIGHPPSCGASGAFSGDVLTTVAPAPAGVLFQRRDFGLGFMRSVACGQVGRNFSAEEWKSIRGDQARRANCPQWRLE